MGIRGSTTLHPAASSQRASQEEGISSHQGLKRLRAHPRSSVPAQACLLASLEQGHRYYGVVAEISSRGGTGRGRGASLPHISPLLASKLFVGWGGKWAGDVSEHIFRLPCLWI